jgi:uncharacterized OsmC-like protein
MTEQALAAAIQRTQKVLKRRPALGIHDDPPATAEWRGGTRVVSRHANGTQILSDMPGEVGGSGDQLTPGWLLRAGLAACATTRIAMGAATAGIELSALEVTATSRSDTRGLLGMTDKRGEPIGAGPMDVELCVRISAPGVSAERLHALVGESCRCSPVPAALQNAIPMALRIEVGPA